MSQRTGQKIDFAIKVMQHCQIPPLYPKQTELKIFNTSHSEFPLQAMIVPMATIYVVRKQCRYAHTNTTH